VSRAEAATMMHHNGRQIVDETLGFHVLTAVLLYIQLRTKLHVHRDLTTVVTTRPPGNDHKTQQMNNLIKVSAISITGE